MKAALVVQVLLLLASAAMGVTKPDLKIGSVTILPEQPSDGEEATVIAAVENSGAASPEFYVALYIDGRPAGTQSVSGLAANGSANLTFRWTARPDHREIRVVADDAEYTGYRNRVDEEREDNNERSAPIRVVLADLVVRSITFVPRDPPHDGEDTTIQVEVENRGNSTRTSFYVALYIDGRPAGTTSVDGGLRAEESRTVRFAWRAFATAASVAAVADDAEYSGYKDRVRETNETNNRFERPVSTRLADLVVENVSLEPDPPGDGENAKVKVKVANRGNSSRTPFYVALYADGKSLGNQYVEGGLAAGATATVHFAWTAQPGTRELRAVADDSDYAGYRDRVRETNETNNALVRDAPVNLSDLTVPRIEIKGLDPGAPLQGQRATVEVTILNAGGLTRRSFYVALYGDGRELAEVYVEGGMAPGQGRILRVPWTPGPIRQITAVADDCHRSGCRDLVAERDEENNAKTVETGIPIPETPAPDKREEPLPTPSSAPSASPSSRPAAPTPRKVDDGQETRLPGASVQLRGEKTQIAVGEEVLLTLSLVNLITNPSLTVQVILKVPSGMSVASSTFAESGAGQYTGVFRAEPGESKHVTVRVRANQAGNFRVDGQLVYFLGEDHGNASQQSVSMPVQVSAPAPESGGGPGDSQIAVRAPGFTFALALAAVCVIALLAGGSRR